MIDIIVSRLGGFATIICIVLLAKFVGRVSKKRTVNKLLHQIHIPLGIAVIILGMMHGIIYLIEYPQAILENLTGIALMLNIILLAGTYYARNLIRPRWITAHRELSISLIVLLTTHIVTAIVLPQ